MDHFDSQKVTIFYLLGTFVTFNLHVLFIILYRCDCYNCVAMPEAEECICCHEVGPVEEILDESGLSCITHHEGFIGNCLNRYVIQVSLSEHVLPV